MYIKYGDDPVRKRVSSAFGNICEGDPKKRTLKLLDKCFSIFNKEEQVAAFCEVSKLQYPVDGFSQVDIEVCSGDTATIFNNNLQSIIAVNGAYPLEAAKTYVRGVILWIQYPTTMDSAVMQSTVKLFDRPATGQFNLKTHELFTHFSNPEGTDATDLLNRLDVHNTNTEFSIKVKALIIHTKSVSDPNDTSC